MSDDLEARSHEHVTAQFTPRRAASWWSVAEDLLWPEKQAREKILRRADALAKSNVDTVVQFGFHCRFDFAWYFGAMHGYFAAIAQALHERGIRFLDHYSCNVVARPRSEEERLKYHSFQRHHVDLYPDRIAAETAGYGGYRYNDLREVDLVTGEPAYTPIYQAELLCHNNPDFLAMHEAYLRRQLAEIPLDGLQQDDMAFYNLFRSCGCTHCRERFQRKYGHELPPLTEHHFWGDTTGDPRMWGNYENPAFRDWVRMRYQTVDDHLAMVRRVIGPDRVLMTCCSASGPKVLNALALSYEHFIEFCDWVLLENCGLSSETVRWARMEPEAMLHKSIGAAKSSEPAPAVACSYATYDDGAYLGWALARFWGVINWISTLRHGLSDDPDDKEEAELIRDLNTWERRYDEANAGDDVVEVRLAFLRANKENGWTNEIGQEYWQRASGWALALLDRNIGYRFLTSRDFCDVRDRGSERAPLILDSCACVSDAEFRQVSAFLEGGGQVWLIPPFGSHDDRGNTRPRPLLEDLLCVETRTAGLRILASNDVPNQLAGLIGEKALSPRITVTGSNRDWRIRLRRTRDGLAIHLLNQALEGVPHPTAMDRWGRARVLDEIRSTASAEPLAFELDVSGLDLRAPSGTMLLSPELPGPRPVGVHAAGPSRFRLTLDMRDIRLYAMLRWGTT